MSQLRLRVFICYRLLFVAKRYVASNFADSIWMNVQERSDVLQVKILHDTGTALQQQLIAFAGCGAVEVDVALIALP